MKRILQLVVTRWLARTPIGMVVLGLGWLFMRKRRARKQQPAQNPAQNPALREPGCRSGNPYARRGPAAGNRR
ncbi:DUF6203 family protein [Microbispora sp. H13382]|uniref:DUF6203 family protein n=1 Tax=Microbispora sp. H13382 TaxID=2729112 RepID=UPI00160302C8|nr:DUF6203 family protein [Microbispora sp. H13382]